MSTMELIAAVESDELHLNVTTTMDSIPYCGVCMNKKHWRPGVHKLKSTKS